MPVAGDTHSEDIPGTNQENLLFSRPVEELQSRQRAYSCCDDGSQGSAVARYVQKHPLNVHYALECGLWP